MRKPHLGLALLAALSLAFGVTRGEAPAAPELAGDVWLGSPPLSLAALRDKVVLVEFWTFACWNRTPR